MVGEDSERYARRIRDKESESKPRVTLTLDQKKCPPRECRVSVMGADPLRVYPQRACVMLRISCTRVLLVHDRNLAMYALAPLTVLALLPS